MKKSIFLLISIILLSSNLYAKVTPSHNTLGEATELRKIPGNTLIYTAEQADNVFNLTNTITINGDTKNLKDNPKFIIKGGGQITVIGAENPESEDVEFKDINKLKFDKDTGFSIISTNQEEVLIKMNSAWTELIPDLNGQEFSPDYSGEWDVDTDYKIGNIVVYNSEYWICKEANKGEQPNESNKWIKLGNLKPQGEEKLSIKVVESDKPGTYWDYSHTNKNEKTFYIGVGPGGERLEHIFNSEIDDAYQIENIKKNYYFDYDESEISEEPYNIIIPESSVDKNDKLTLYLHQAPSIFAYYNIEPDNILDKSYPREKFWLEDEKDGVWTFELKSPPGCTDWNISQYTKRDVGTFVEWIINDEGTIIGYNPSTLKGRIRIPASVNGTNVVALDDELFMDQTEVTYFELSEGLEYIGADAFNNSGITEIVFPESVRTIADSACANCYSLEEITLGNNIESIEVDAFNSSPIDTVYFIRQEDESHDDAEQRFRDLLEDAHIETNPYYCDITPVEWNWEYDEDTGTITYGYPPVGEKIGAVIIPSEINGVKITKLGVGSSTLIPDGKNYITKLIISDGIKQINQNTLDWLPNARVIELPNSLKSIDNWTLRDEYKLKRIYIPENVIELGYGFTRWCNELKSIKVSKKNQEYTSQDGVLFSKDMSTLITYPVGRTNEIYEIPTNVKILYNDSFNGTSNLTNIIIPESVEKFYSSVFTESAIQEIYIPDSVTDFDDCDYLFDYCGSLERARLPQNMTYIPEGMFEGCFNLTEIEIPETVTAIGTYAFSECESLENINIPSNLVTIESCAFESSGITNILLPQTIEEIGEYAFGSTSLTSFEWPETITEIQNGIFSYCQSFTNILIPNTVTIIWNNVFANTKLTDVTIPASVKSIGREIFRDCTTLTNVIFEGDIESIGEQIFLRCENLMDVYFPEKYMNDVQNMDNYPWALQKDCRIHCKDGDIIVPKLTSTFTFSDGHSEEILIEGTMNNRYQNRTDLVSVEFGDRVMNIGNQAFWNCFGLENVIMGNNVTNIDMYAFHGCHNLINVIIGNSVLNIGMYAFWYCHGLINITIPNSVTNIRDHAFGWCTNLTNIIILSDVRDIGNEAFVSCDNLTDITFQEKTKSEVLAMSNFPWSLPDACTIHCSDGDIRRDSTFTFSDGSSTRTIINGTMDNRYQSRTDLVSVELGDNITSIANYAFSGCSGLTNVIIHTSTTSVGEFAFYVCRSLTSIIIPDSVMSIGGAAFYGCSGLTNVTIPENVTSIEQWTFYDCRGLTNVIIPDRVTSIANDSFSSCRGLMSVTIGNGVTNIEGGAFFNCTNLSTINYTLKPNQTAEDRKQEIIDMLTSSGFNISQITSWNVITEEVEQPQQTPTTRKKINTTEQETGINTSSEQTLPDITEEIEQPTEQPQQAPVSSKLSTFTFKDKHTEEIDLEKTMDNRFQSNNELVSVSFGTNISVISERAFSGCKELTNITFNNNLIAIGGYAFYNCNSLENINLPTNLTTIARFAFAQCNNLTSITIPNTITIIANKAFNGCIKLTTINFILKQNETEEDGQQRIQTLLSNSGFDTSQITTWNPISQ